MKICPSCKLQFSDEKKFCNRCGTRLLPEQAATPDSIAKRQLFEARLAADPGDPLVINEYAAYLISIHLYDEARPLLLKALEREPKNSTLRRRLAALYQVDHDWDNAAAQLLLLIQEEP